MSDPRWTDETVDDMARKLARQHAEIWGYLETLEDIGPYVDGEAERLRGDVESLLAALADAGLLLPPGGETREWGVRYPQLHPEPIRCGDEQQARRTAEGEGRVLVSRTVHVGPWQATP